MSSPTATEAAVREAIRNQLTAMPLDKIHGQPTNTTVNHLVKQIARMAAAVKTTQWGGRHGCLPLAIDDAEYQRITGDPLSTTD